MDYILAAITWVLGVLASIVWWVVTQVFWIVLWLVLPIAIVAVLAVRIAERVFGQERVREWVKARTQRYGAAVSKRAQRLLFALGMAPVRVLFWFVIYALWHSIVSLLWRPKWTPWGRAWGKRWRAQPRG